MISISSTPKPQTFPGIPLLMIIAAILGSMSINIFTPALPTMAEYFICDKDATQLLLSLNFGGIALSGFLLGPLSETFGRRPLFLVGFFIFFLTSYLSFFATSIKILMILQTLQGFGVGVGTVLSMAVIGDIYQGKKAAKIFSYLGLAVPLSPAFSPFIGGYITDHLGWKSIFLTLGTIGLLFFLLLIWKLPETLPIVNKIPFSFSNKIRRYKNTLKNPLFLRFASLPCLGFSGIWAYNAVAPFVFINNWGLSATSCGYYSIISIIGIIIGSSIVNRLTHKWHSLSFVRFGSLLCLCSTFFFLFLVLKNISIPLPYALTMTLYCVGFGFIFSSSLTLAMEYTHYGKGFGAALIRSSQILSGSLAIAISGSIYKNSFFEPVLFILTCAFLLTIIAWTSPKIFLT